MHHESSIFKLFLKYETWEKYNKYLEAKDFPEELQLLYRTLDSWHKTNESKADLHLQDLANLFFSNRPKDKEFYQELFNSLEKYEPNEETVLSLVKAIRRAKILREVSIKAYEVAEAKIPYDKLAPLLASLNEEENQENEQSDEDDFVTDDLAQIVNVTYQSPGLRWRLKTLNLMLGSLRKGNFGFVFARPETGKTTFLSSEVTYFAEQLAEGDIVLWLNNEEVHENVRLRQFQAASACQLEQLLANVPFYQQEFLKKTGGRIKMPTLKSFSKQDVERLCKKYKPKLIVVDQIDKITGFAADREDLLLGSIYQWARELAKQYGPVIGVCQADASGENQKWLTMANVANAKTSKQAEADWILGIGKIHDTGWDNIRFLHLSKNKLFGDPDSDPKLRHGRCEVVIDPTTARYQDLQQ
jgi:replicative DNA helicase